MKLTVKQLRALINEVSEPKTYQWRALTDIIDFIAEETDDFSRLTFARGPRSEITRIANVVASKFSHDDIANACKLMDKQSNRVKDYAGRMSDRATQPANFFGEQDSRFGSKVVSYIQYVLDSAYTITRETTPDEQSSPEQDLFDRMFDIDVLEGEGLDEVLDELEALDPKIYDAYFDYQSMRNQATSWTSQPDDESRKVGNKRDSVMKMFRNKFPRVK